jgi:hypothetical protein
MGLRRLFHAYPTSWHVASHLINATLRIEPQRKSLDLKFHERRVCVSARGDCFFNRRSLHGRLNL